MSFYSIGTTSLAQDLGVTKYRTTADEMAGRSGGVSHGVLAFKKNNLLPDVYHYPSGDGATAKYDELAESPGEYVYLYLYRDSKPVDEAYFTATAQRDVVRRTETRKERVGLGWILGGVGLGMLGLAIGFRKKS